MTTRFCIVRHGETDWNVEKRIQGHTDVPLNATGRAQALAMSFNAAHHRFSAIYSSDLSRAMETARYVAEREGGLRQLRSYRRHLADDFELAFGEAPGALQAMAVTTDGDNTGSALETWYGDITLD